MKKLLFLFAILFSVSAMAQNYYELIISDSKKGYNVFIQSDSLKTWVGGSVAPIDFISRMSALNAICNKYNLEVVDFEIRDNRYESFLSYVYVCKRKN